MAAVRTKSHNGLHHHRRRLAHGPPRRQRGPHRHRPPTSITSTTRNWPTSSTPGSAPCAPYQGYPDMPSTRAVQEVQNAAPDGFQATAARVWRECRRVLKPGGCLLFSFHQSQTTGWCALMRSLSDAGFTVTTTRAVIAEVATSLSKTAAAEPNRIDVIVLCRDAAGTSAGAAPTSTRPPRRRCRKSRASGEPDCGWAPAMSAPPYAPRSWRQEHARQPPTGRPCKQRQISEPRRR